MSDAGYISDSDTDSGIGRPHEPLEPALDEDFSSESETEAEEAVNPPPEMQLQPEQASPNLLSILKFGQNKLGHYSTLFPLPPPIKIQNL